METRSNKRLAASKLLLKEVMRKEVRIILTRLEMTPAPPCHEPVTELTPKEKLLVEKSVREDFLVMLNTLSGSVELQLNNIQAQLDRSDPAQ